MWNFKNKKIEFWCDVDGLSLLDEVKPRPAKEFFPKWIKQAKKNEVYNPEHRIPDATISKCPMPAEYLTQGYIIPMWCDTVLGHNEKGWYWRTSSTKFKWDIHPDNQFIDYLPNHMHNYFVFKAISPWFLKTPKGWSVYQQPLFYYFQEDWQIVPGTFKTDFYYDLNQHILIKKNSEIFIPRGTPFVWYIPYKREKLGFSLSEMTTHKKLITKASNMIWHSKFTGGYKIESRKHR